MPEWYIPDNYDAFEEYEASQEAELKRLPVCCECDYPIQDEYCFEFEGEYICEKCLKENHRKPVEDCI